MTADGDSGKRLLTGGGPGRRLLTGGGPGRRLLAGGALVLAADALQLPGAILLGAFLARRLGAEGLALYLIAASFVTWIELVVSALFSRAAVQMVAQAERWQPVAALVLRWHAAIGLGAAAALALGLLPFEEVGGVAGLRRALLLFALEIPLFALARSHTHVLVGLGRYRERALASAVRWTSRLLLSIALVALGFGVDGAVLGAVASTALELLAARAAVRIPLDAPRDPALAARLRRLSAPLFLHGIALQLFHRLGLFLLLPLGATTAAAGIYGAADSLLRLRRVLGQSLTPLVLSALAGLRRQGDTIAERQLAVRALRLSFVSMVPVAAVAGSAARVMEWLFGAPFATGGRALALLVWGAPAFLVLSIAGAILVAGERARTTAALTVPMVPAAAAGYVWAVPRFGIEGAAAVTSAIAVATAVAALVAAARIAGVRLPPATVARTAVAAALAFFSAYALPGRGSWLLLVLPAATLAGFAALVLLGETGAAELRALRTWIRERRAASRRESATSSPLLDDPG